MTKSTTGREDMEKKRIDQILYEMNQQIELHYNIRNPLIKITITHEAFDSMVLDMAEHTKYSAKYTPAWMNDFEIFGVRIEARNKPS
jgi:2-keto-3-deoxy-L-rhamnonate aldolase RhmA